MTPRGRIETGLEYYPCMLEGYDADSRVGYETGFAGQGQYMLCFIELWWD